MFKRKTNVFNIYELKDKERKIKKSAFTIVSLKKTRPFALVLVWLVKLWTFLLNKEVSVDFQTI